MISRLRSQRLVMLILLGACAAAPLSVRTRAQARPPVQHLKVEGDRFLVNRGEGFKAEFLVFISYFDALKATSLGADLDYIRDRGFHGIRIFGTWQDFRGSPADERCLKPYADNLFDANGNVRGDNADGSITGPLAALIRVLKEARDRGLIVDVSFDHATVPGLSVDNYRRALTRIATLLREHRHVIFDLQNERDLENRETFLTPAQVSGLRTAIKATDDPARGDPGRILVASTTGEAGIAGTLAFVQEAGLDAIAFHDERVDGWQDRVTRVVAGLRRPPSGSSAGRPIYLQEPMPWAPNAPMCAAAPGDPDPAHFRTAVRNAKAAGAAAWTFHIQNTFIADDKPLWDKVDDDAALYALLHGASGEPGLTRIADSTAWGTRETRLARTGSRVTTVW